MSGKPIPDSDRDSLLTAMLQRGVVLAVSGAVGDPNDPAQAQAAFQTPEVRVAREVFLAGMAKLLYQEADLFGPMRMDRQDRFILMCRTALDVLETVPQSQEVEAFAAEIRGTLKQFGGV